MLHDLHDSEIIQTKLVSYSYPAVIKKQDSKQQNH